MACNCNEEGKTINIGMGCCVPIVANADAYYTKSEIDEKIDEIVISGGGITSGEVQTMIDESIADKADKSEIPTVPTKVSSFENDVPYLTQHQSLSGYATEQWVLDKHYISGVDLSDYATKEYVSGFTYDKATIDEKVAGGGTFDPTQYYNKTQTNELLDNKLDASAYTPCDLSNYYTKSETNNKISSSTADMATMTWVGQQGYLTEHQSLSGYATEQWVEDKHYITGVDLSDYATEQWVQNQGYLTEHQSLSAYSTTQEVANMINQSVSGKQDSLSAGTGIDITNNVISATGGGASYSASSGINITNNEISTKIGSGLRYAQDGTLEVNSTNAIASGNTQVPLSYVVHNYINNNCMLKSKIWCGTQQQYDAITTKDSETLYLIHS